MKRNEAVFASERRIHIGLGVQDVARSTAFYQLLLDSPPVKERPGYAKFEPADPSVNLALNEVSSSDAQCAPAQHFGVQVKSSEAVAAATRRLEDAGLEVKVQESTTCCYAVQDKVWVSDPDGNRWEVFVVLDADAAARGEGDVACCETDRRSSVVDCDCC